MRFPFRLLCLAAVTCSFSCSSKAPALHIVSTGDLHGAYFPETYSDNRPRPSLMSVMHYVDSLRSAVGEENVILLDAGDFMQGDNASYYYNYVSGSEHIFPRLAAYMGYDAVVGGNHDIETGHPVYDRVAAELERNGIPFLSGNAITPSGKLYFRDHVLLKKGGRKILVLGFNNANIASWLSEDVWSGMRFESLTPLVFRRVSELAEKYRPDAVVVVVHSGTGSGNGSELESQGMDIFQTMEGVDLLITAHDHKPFVRSSGNSVIMNSGSRAGHVGHCVVSFEECSQEKSVSAEVVRLDKCSIDEGMKTAFRPDYDSVKVFTMREVGVIQREMKTRDAYVGMCDYMNLIHTVQLSVPDVDISFSAPLTYDGTVKAGTLVYNDMFTLYPFENKLFVLNMKGSEVISYLENSYDNWIVNSAEHTLKIAMKSDPHVSSSKWAFLTRPYNLDSAAGLNYTVDVTAERGSRINVISMADGSPFDPDGWYNVAMTSYRANGGGGLLSDGPGLTPDMVKERIAARYPEIRELVYQFIRAYGSISPELISSPSLIGSWRFVPEEKAERALRRDMECLFHSSR